jgi:L-2-hydroxyglutarate oxidase LhgO
MEEVKVIIIGAGVIGLAIARQLSLNTKNLVVLEKNKSFGQETSSRNSEVIHAGMYYPTGTQKAKMCVEGRHLLYELCKKNNIPHKKIGKIIVATEKEEIPALEALFELGKKNGVEDLQIIEQKTLKEMEPNVVGIAALYSHQTGIVDSHKLMQYFYDTAKDNGAIVVFNSEVTAIEKIKDGYLITINNNGDTDCLKTRAVINCAGLDSDNIADMAGIDIKKNKYQLYYCKGQYFRVNASKAKQINRLVYPVPKPKSAGLGIHATLDLSGGMRLGPDDEYLKDRNKDYTVNNSRLGDFYSSAKKFMPFIDKDDLSVDISGIRPKLQEPGGPFRDFAIQEESEKGFPNFINLIGIESPGLTASCSIANYVSGLFSV